LKGVPLSTRKNEVMKLNNSKMKWRRKENEDIGHICRIG
jgi:hypothetical protein